MLTIIALAAFAAPQEIALDPVPFRPSEAPGGALLSVAQDDDRPFLGVAMGPDGSVTRVVENSAAASAGLLAGDVLLRIGGHEIEGAQDVIDAVAAHAAGDSVHVLWLRGEEKMDADVILGEREEAPRVIRIGSGGLEGLDLEGGEMDVEIAEMLRGLGYFEALEEEETDAPVIGDGVPAPLRALGYIGGVPTDATPAQDGAWLGVSISPTDSGVAIADVVDGGPAANAGLRAGDRIVAIGGVEVDSVDDVVDALGSMRAGRTAGVAIERDGEGRRSVRVKLGARPGSGAEQRPEPRGGLFFLEGADEPAPQRPRAQQQQRGSVDREAVRELRRSYDEAMHAMHQRHAEEEAALRERFSRRFEDLGVNPLRVLGARDLSVPGGRGLLFDGGGDVELFMNGQRIEMPPMIEGLMGRDGEGGELQRQIRERIAEGLSQGRDDRRIRMPRGAQSGEQHFIEVEVTPDGRRVERRKIGRMVDGEWQWTEEVIEGEADGEAPQPWGIGVGVDGPMPRGFGVPAPAPLDPSSDISAQLDALRRQLDQLERRNARLMERLER